MSDTTGEVTEFKARLRSIMAAGGGIIAAGGGKRDPLDDCYAECAEAADACLEGCGPDDLKCVQKCGKAGKKCIRACRNKNFKQLGATGGAPEEGDDATAQALDAWLEDIEKAIARRP